jgi:nanoRNase/pAp phosphatase (c-di-AMP/oligoRNAs hydrolase)
MKHYYDKILKLLEDSQNILIATHIRPDGDALGSSIGTYLVLRKIFKEKNIDLYF